MQEPVKSGLFTKAGFNPKPNKTHRVGLFFKTHVFKPHACSVRSQTSGSFPVAEHRRPLTGTKLYVQYCMVTQPQVKSKDT